jgi:hypothetical protein
MSTRPLGRPQNRWEDDVKYDVINMRINNWQDCIRNRPKWKVLVKKDKISLMMMMMMMRRRRRRRRSVF